MIFYIQKYYIVYYINKFNLIYELLTLNTHFLFAYLFGPSNKKLAIF